VRYQDLDVWRRAHVLTVQLLADRRLDGVVSARLIGRELRRSAMSVCANLVEGACSSSRPSFKRYVGIAAASAAELEYFTLAARDTRVIPEDAADALLDEISHVRRMLFALRAKLSVAYTRAHA